MNVLKDKKRLVTALRLVAKIWSILSIGFLLFAIIGEAVFPATESSQFANLVEIIAMIFFPFGVMVGMAMAWKWEKIGGIVTIISLLVFYILILIPRSAFRGIPFSLFIAGPGFLFLACSLISKRNIAKERK
jgi:hypothetical protein